MDMPIDSELILKNALSEVIRKDDYISSIVDCCLTMASQTPVEGLEFFKGKDSRDIAWEAMQSPSVKNMLMSLINDVARVVIETAESDDAAEEAVDSIRDWD